MDAQYEVLSEKIDDLSEKIDGLANKVTNLQVQSADGTLKFRVETAEREITMLFDRHREQEKAVELRKEIIDERLQKLDSMVSSKVAFWKGAAWLASGLGAALLVIVDIALRVMK